MSTSLGIKSFYYLVVLSIIALVLYALQTLFIPLLIAYLLASLLKPLVSFFEQRGFSQQKVIISIYLIAIAVLSLFFIYILPIIVHDMLHFSKQLPQYLEHFQSYLSGLQEGLSSRFDFLTLPDLSLTLKEQFQSRISEMSSYLSRYIGNLLSLLSFALIIPFISFFILKDMHLLQKTLLSYVPNRYFEMFVLLFYKIGNAIQLYIRGQLIDASFVGIMTGIGLLLIGFPYALLVGLVAGIGNLVPYFGPILGAIPAIFIIFVTPEYSDAGSILMVVAVFAVVQVIETLFVYPYAVGNSVNLHPLLILLALLVGGQIAGILGMIIIIPIVAILKVTFELLYEYLHAYRILGT